MVGEAGPPDVAMSLHKGPYLRGEGETEPTCAPLGNSVVQLGTVHQRKLHLPRRGVHF